MPGFVHGRVLLPLFLACASFYRARIHRCEQQDREKLLRLRVPKFRFLCPSLRRPQEKLGTFRVRLLPNYDLQNHNKDC